MTGTAIDTWLRGQAEREKRVRYLEDALLGNQGAAYVRYRLRYFTLRCLSSAALHGIRLTFLHYIFSHQTFLTTLLLNAVAALIGTFWWGALEVLRRRVRELARGARRHRVPGEIGRWLSLAGLVSGAFLALAVGWIAWDMTHRGRGFDLLHLYVFAVALRLAAEIMTLTFHSGIYALRRVYRPLPAILGVEIGCFVAVVAMWPWLGRWSFPIGALLSTCVSTGVVVHYTARLYRLLGLLPEKPSRPPFRQLATWRSMSELLGAGTSYALMKLDAFLVLALFHRRFEDVDGVSLFVVLVSISPAIQAGFDWAQLFYFDLKRLEGRCLRALRQRYETLVARLAVTLGFAFWGFACLLGTLITRRNLGELYWYMGPFFLARSALALAQIRAFSDRRYGDLLRSGALLLAAMVAVRLWVPDDRLALLAVAGGTLAALGALRVWRPRRVPESERGQELPLIEWLERLKEVEAPVRIRSLRFGRRADVRGRAATNAWVEENRWRHTRLAARIATRVNGTGGVTLTYPDRITWYELAGRPSRVTDAWLLRCGGGLIDGFESGRVHGDGSAALADARTRGLVATGVRAHGPAEGPDVARVLRAFSRKVPGGVSYAPDAPIPPLLEALSSRERRSVLFAALHFAARLRAGRPPGLRYDVSSFCVAGELRLIFLIDRRVDPRVRARWAAWIRRTNLEAALAPARRDDPEALYPSAATRG